jgi:hypothetical protein
MFRGCSEGAADKPRMVDAKGNCAFSKNAINYSFAPASSTP